VPLRDEEANSGLEELLAISEKAEAEALRRELVAFLKSPEARAEIEAIVRKPLEALVVSALQSGKLQEQLRTQLVATLTPKLVEAAQTAAADALRDVQVSLDDKAQKAMRAKASATLKAAFADAENDAFESLPRLAEQTKRQVREHIDKAVRDAVSESMRSALGDVPTKVASIAPYRRLAPQQWQLPAMLFVGLLVIAGGVYLALRKPAQIIGTSPVSTATFDDPTPIDEGSTAETPPAPQPPRLFDNYRIALSRATPTTLPPATTEQLQCIESGIRAADGNGVDLDVAALRTSLRGCAATQRPPSGASPIVANVQAQLTEEASAHKCAALKPLTIDGMAGAGTAGALQKYVSCTQPAGLSADLTTIGDYATAGVYFLYKRLRENP
jgi:hypothetical protein